MDFSYGKLNQPSNRQTNRLSRDESDDESDEEDDPNEADLWKKRSIFFELPYWEHHILRHNLDVMHIEKNVCENVIQTILNVDGKSKDNLQSRLDLVHMGIRRDLHPQVRPNGKYWLPPTIFSMSKEEKEMFCTVLKDIKVPDAYASNISRCVSLKDRRLYSLKSHDYHILMQDLLPVALRCCMSKKVTSCIIELSNIMKAICGKVLNVEELEKVQDRAALTLCNLEKIFPPSFFTIMVHLVIHLPCEAIIGGSVFYRWIYPIESGNIVNDEVKWLSQGPNRVVKRYSCFIMNGFRFHTKYRDRLRRTQNCGVVVNSLITSYASARDSNPVEGNVEYYGLLTDIIELDYYGKWKVVLFRCDWADANTACGIKNDQFGKMPRRRLRDLSIVQNTTNSEEVSTEQQTVVGSSSVPETLDESVEFQTENGRMRRGRGRTLLTDLYKLNSVERVKITRNSHGQPVRQEARLLAGYLGIIARNANMLPINYESWYNMPDSNKNQALFNIKERFALEVSDAYIKKALGKKWRDHKSILKKEYFKKPISLEEKLQNVPPGMLRYQWEDAVRFWNSKKGEEASSGQKVGRLQLFDITHRKKDGTPMTSEAAEIMEKLKDKKAEYEATASTDSSVNFEDIDNRIINEVLGPESTYEQISQLRAEAAAREAEAAAREAEQNRKYNELQLQLQSIMTMFQQFQNPPS
ncbi:hypothetical protein PVK06_035005 [Gossypium arboreum]|uniref:DUF4218 domain-containing protein n=1 Tax=Gossypium arboreum TaxID=29729 RepID=A0ABR0NFR4_GOSAR|nr:hypothetical protein PVK06_035005 [Gossypium arboreum]